MTIKRAMKSASTSDSSPTKKMKTKIKFNVLRLAYRKNQRILKNRKQIIYRRSKKIKKISMMLIKLKSNNFLTEEEFQRLKEISTTSSALISRFIIKSKGQKVPKKCPTALKPSQ